MPFFIYVVFKSKARFYNSKKIPSRTVKKSFNLNNTLLSTYNVPDTVLSSRASDSRQGPTLMKLHCNSFKFSLMSLTLHTGSTS